MIPKIANPQEPLNIFQRKSPSKNKKLKRNEPQIKAFENIKIPLANRSLIGFIKDRSNYYQDTDIILQFWSTKKKIIFYQKI